jgi:hypothetical protein
MLAKGAIIATVVVIAAVAIIVPSVLLTKAGQ